MSNFLIDKQNMQRTHRVEMQQKVNNRNSRSSSHNTTIKRSEKKTNKSIFFWWNEKKNQHTNTKLTTVQHNDQRIESKSEWCPPSLSLDAKSSNEKQKCLHACMQRGMLHTLVKRGTKKNTNNNVGVESIRKIVLSIYFSQRLKTLFQHSREQNEK